MKAPYPRKGGSLPRGESGSMVRERGVRGRFGGRKRSKWLY